MSTTGKLKQIAFIIFVIVVQVPDSLQGQTGIPGILEDGTLQEQMDYIQERTRIYDNFRAIREDMFQKVMNNSLDSLVNAKREIGSLTSDINSLHSEIDSLSALLENTRDDLDLAVRNRDSIAFLGIPMNKTGYNLMVWVIIAALATLLVLGLMIYSRNQVLTSRTLRELEELKQEFENYRISSREKREKLVMEHFNEIKKLKNG
ncbi:MAG: hypothetical protein R6U58_14885 [Bacteroidales bacterium]